MKRIGGIVVQCVLWPLILAVWAIGLAAALCGAGLFRLEDKAGRWGR